MKLVIGFLVLGITLLHNPARSQAAPFCVVTPEMKNFCYYYDPKLCREEARRLAGICMANRAEVKIPEHTSGQFCVVLASKQVQCVYHSYRQCETEALRQNGICITKSRTLSPIDDIRQNRLRRDGETGVEEQQPPAATQDNPLSGLPSPEDNPLFRPGLDIRLNN